MLKICRCRYLNCPRYKISREFNKVEWHFVSDSVVIPVLFSFGLSAFLGL